jgi:hypothetical protein
MSRALTVATLLLALAANAQAKTFGENIHSLIPNTIAIDASQSETNVSLKDGDPLNVQRHRAGDTLGPATQIIDSVTLTVLHPPDSKEERAHYAIVPILSVAFFNFGIESKAAYFRETDFQVFRTSFGIGPEMTIDVKIGTFTLALAPGVSYSWMSWSSPVSGGELQQPNANIAISCGYYKYFGQHWAVRGFLRAVREDVALWDKALDRSQGFDIPVDAVGTTTYGASIAYSF